MIEAEHFKALFDPRGVVIAGASTHPGKYGFVALHNLLAGGYQGEVFAINRSGEPVLGRPTLRSADELPAGRADLVFVCTPVDANIELLRSCAAKGVRAAFVAAAGYGELGGEGERAQHALVAEAERLGVLLAGPNGQGVVSTPSSLCAQIVAPMPPRGRIGVASQSGNFVSSFMNWSCASDVGISRAVSAGNAAAVTVADYLDFYASDPETAVGLAYVEGITDGRAFYERMRSVAARMPVVVVKGGATEGGAAAAASHTGALAANDRIFEGACRQAGVVRAATVEDAFEAAATFATQPLPAGPNVAVITAAGGWGVVTADALTAHRELALMPLPDDLRSSVDQLLPPRWSHSNPIDMAGGETRETVPALLDLVAGHSSVHAVIYLGLGIQSNQAKLMREGGAYPGFGLDRITSFHERQDERYAQAIVEASERHGKPVLGVSELAVADPSNPGPHTLRELGKVCYASANRAVTALGHLYRYARFTQARR